ncbi:MAG: hypothetical protein AAGH99_02200 [Planctomycetota bacterium]
MRIDPRTSLSVQLIQQANFGSERFEPFGFPLRRDLGAEVVSGPLAFCPAIQNEIAIELNPPITGKPETRPTDVYICDGRLRHIDAYVNSGQLIEAEPTAEVEVREVVVPTTLPVHVVGSLLDVLA